MERKTRLDALKEEIQKLKVEYVRLGELFSDQGERMISPGILPDAQLLQEITNATHRFNFLADKMRQSAEELSWEGFEERTMDSLASMEATWQVLADHLEQIYILEKQERAKQQARRIVLRAIKATTTEEGISEEMNHFKARLTRYDEIISRTPADEESKASIDQLIAKQHPINYLLHLAENHLDLRSSVECFKVAEKEFGTLLALAAVMGKLVFPGSDQEISDHDIAEDILKTREAGPEEQKKEVAELTTGLVKDAVEVKGTEPETAPFSSAKSSQGNAGEVEETADFASDSAREIPIEDDSVEKRPEQLEEHILRFIREGRISPAYWLTCYYEQEFKKPAPAPSLLVRALEFSKIIAGDGGPAAEWLAYFNRQREFESIVQRESTDGNSLALKILAFESLIRPALVAPGTLASSMLEKMVGLPEELQKISAVIKEWEHEKPAQGKTFKESAEDLIGWDQQADGMGMVHSHQVMKMWEKMQEEGGIIHTLLQPILENHADPSEELVQLVAHLKSEERIQDEILSLYRNMQYLVGPLDFFEIPDSWQLLSQLREAVRLTDRWIKYNNSEALYSIEDDGVQPTESQGILLKNLLASAREELEDLAHDYEGNNLLFAAVSLCKESALKFLEEFLAEEKPKTLPAEKVRYLELRKNEQLTINPPWNPQREQVKKIGEALIELLNKEDASVYRKIAINYEGGHVGVFLNDQGEKGEAEARDEDFFEELSDMESDDENKSLYRGTSFRKPSNGSQRQGLRRFSMFSSANQSNKSSREREE